MTLEFIFFKHDFGIPWSESEVELPGFSSLFVGTENKPSSKLDTETGEVRKV